MLKNTTFCRIILIFFACLLIGTLINPDYSTGIYESNLNQQSIEINEKNPKLTPQNNRVTPEVSKNDEDFNNIEDNLDSILKVFPNDFNLDVLIEVNQDLLESEIFLFGNYGKIKNIINGTHYSGFAGRICLKELKSFIATSKNYKFISQNQEALFTLRKSMEQMRIYPEIRNQYGLKGDKYSTIAILDRGIDDSHPTFKDKIIYWDDYTSENYATPQDERGHGTQVASIASGKPYNTTDSLNRTIITNFLYYDYSSAGLSLNTKYYQTLMWLNLTYEGNISISGNWFNPDSGQTPVNVTEIILVNSSDEVMVNEFSIINQTINLNYMINNTNYGLYRLKAAFNLTSQSNSRVGYNLSIHLPENVTNLENLYSGVAPNTQLVMLRVIYESEILQAMNWILENYTNYNITTVIMSFIINSGTVQSLANSMVSKGIFVSCAAGNDYFGQNFAGSTTHAPGSADKVMSVGAVNYNNSLSSYSAQGGLSTSGQTTKPDILAPGGEFPSYQLPNQRIYCSDSNDKEYLSDTYLGKYNDVNPNDTTGVVGTSFSAPFVGGVAQLLIEKLGGEANWNYSESEALFIKNLMLLTASETYPNKRTFYPDYTPTLDRGIKDIHEGYGVINPDVCLDAISNSIIMNTTEHDMLYSINSSNGQLPACWARKITLPGQAYYDLNLSVPVSADFDLYLYDYNGNQYGDPIIISKSCSAGKGIDESIHKLVRHQSGNYFLVVKGVLGQGQFSFSVQKLNITYDITSPNSQVLLPADQYIGWGTIYIEGTATDELLKVENITLIIESRAGFINYTVINPPLVFNYSWDTTINDDGGCFIRIYATDSYGNSGYSAVISILVRNYFVVIPGLVISSIMALIAIYYLNKLSKNLLASESFMSYIDKIIDIFKKPSKIELKKIFRVANAKKGINFASFELISKRKSKKIEPEVEERDNE